MFTVNFKEFIWEIVNVFLMLPSLHNENKIKNIKTFIWRVITFNDYVTRKWENVYNSKK